MSWPRGQSIVHTLERVAVQLGIGLLVFELLYILPQLTRTLTHTLTHSYSHAPHTHTQTNEEELVAIKTCKPDASSDDRAKFLEEAGRC